MVLLPHFNLDEYDKANLKKWSAKALAISSRIANQLIAIDAFYQRKTGQTPPPDWLGDFRKPRKVATAALAPIATNDGTSITRSCYASCVNSTSVVVYTVIDGGRAWPGG
jgi:hypothetical protein